MDTVVEKLRTLYDSCDSPSENDVQQVLGSLEFCEKALSNYIHFDSQRYTRNLITYNDKFSVLVMCWDVGQCTPLHSHGDDDGIQAHSRVLQGELMLTRYSKATTQFSEAFPYQVKDTKRFGVDSSVYDTEEELGYHVLQNPSSEDQAVSIHVYSPPYIECCYGQENQEFVPVVYCAKTGHTLATSDRLDLQTKFQHNPVFLNMAQLCDLLRREIVIHPDDESKCREGESPVPHSIANIEHVKSILKSVHLHPGEWRKYSNFENDCYTRNLIGYDSKFTALALCWNKGQMSPIHDHARSSCWVKVLEGEMEESIYTYNKESGECDMQKQTVLTSKSGTAYINNSYGLHRMGNPRSDSVTVSLHIYSPPIKNCNVYLDNGATIKQVSLQAANGAVNEFVTRGTKRAHPESEAAGNTPLDNLVEDLDQAVSAKDHDKIEQLLSGFDLPREEWETSVHFNKQQYTRNCLAFNERFSLVLNCWNNGQGSPVHDHGIGERTAYVKVLSGSLTLKRYESNEPDAKEIPLSTRIFNEGEKTTRLENADLGSHALRNSSDDHTAVSLHLYTPPMLDVHNEQEGSYPVSFCRKSSLSDNDDELAVQIDCCRGQSAAKVYSNLRALTDLLRLEFSKCVGDVDKSELHKRIHHCMSYLELNPHEFQSYYKKGQCNEYTRSLVAFDERFAVYLICWQPGQSAPIHDHAGSAAWVRVLQGQLTDQRFERDANNTLVPGEVSVLSAGSASMAPTDVIHRTANKSNDVAFSLHVYSPPYKSCTFYDIESQTSTEGSMTGIFNELSTGA